MKSCVRRRNILSFVVITYFFLAFGCASSVPPPDLYDNFKNYRTVISEDQRNCFRFFSRNMLQGTIDSILYSWEAVPTMALDRHRNLFLSGGKVEIVHEKFVSRVDKRTFYLEIHYSNKYERGLRRLGISYVEENGLYLIDSFDYYLESLGEIPTEVVDDFSNFAIPSVREVLDIEEGQFNTKDQ